MPHAGGPGGAGQGRRAPPRCPAVPMHVKGRVSVRGRTVCRSDTCVVLALVALVATALSASLGVHRPRGAESEVARRRPGTIRANKSFNHRHMRSAAYASRVDGRGRRRRRATWQRPPAPACLLCPVSTQAAMHVVSTHVLAGV